MSHIIPEHRIYKNAVLMRDFNELQIRIKTYLYNIGDEKFKIKHPKPTVAEMDEMMNRIMEVLKQDSYNPKKH